MFPSARKTWAITALLSIAFSSASLQAAPTISSVDTSQLAQGVITIKGSGFGSAPKIEVYDDFEHSGAKHGDVVDRNQAIIGGWSASSSASQPTYDDIALSGNYSYDAWHNGTSRTAQLTHHFQTPVQSIYYSYWIKIPPGYPFPGMDSAISGYFSTDSSWKFSWFIDQDYLGNSSDMFGPAYTGKGGMIMGGNDGRLAYLNPITDFWSIGNWLRVTAWLEADPNAPTTNGYMKVQFWTAAKGFNTRTYNQRVFDADGPATKQYKYVNIPGWIRGFPGNNGRPLYDDIYISSGANAYARVELTDNNDYNKSTKFAIQKPISWSNTQISFQVVKSNITNVGNASIHVFNGAGEAIASGSKVGSGSSTPVVTSPPRAPTLQVSVSN